MLTHLRELPFTLRWCQTQTLAISASYIFIATETFDKSNFRCNKNNPLTIVRGFALAGAIGIEPTQWESEAQVLPLHQAPSLKALYNIIKKFANTFCK